MGDSTVDAVVVRTNAAVYAALTAQTLVSAGTYLAATRAMYEVPPETVMVVRLVLGGVVFAALLLTTPGRVLPPARAVPMLSVLGFLAGPCNQGLFLYGLSLSTPAHAALLYALTPIGVYLLSVATGRERATAMRVWGIGIAFVGVVVLLLGRGLMAALGPLVGDLFILAAVAAWVVYTTEGKRLLAEHGPIRTTAWTIIAGGLFAAPMGPAFLDVERLRTASATAWLCIGYLVVLTSVVAYLLWYFALSRIAASKAAVFTNLQPVATALAAWVVLGEPLVWEVWVGGALVLAGVRLTQRTG